MRFNFQTLVLQLPILIFFDIPKREVEPKEYLAVFAQRPVQYDDGGFGLKESFCFSPDEGALKAYSDINGLSAPTFASSANSSVGSGSANRSRPEI